MSDFTENQLAYLDYINDASEAHPVVNRGRVEQVDSLQDMIDGGRFRRLGNALISADIPISSGLYSEIKAGVVTNQIGRAVISGYMTELKGEIFIGDECIIENTRLNDVKVRKSKITGSIASPSNISRSTVWLSRLHHVNLEGGFYEYLGGSTGGKLWEGDLRNASVGYNHTTSEIYVSQRD